MALAVFHTWPLAAAPGKWCRHDNGDALLNEWAVAWVAHQVVSDPRHLFDANIFYPEKRTLAFSERLVPQALLVAPIIWLGGSPLVAFNVSLLAGFVLTGWVTCLVLRRWTGNWAAGLIAGSLAAFNAHSLTRLAHLQAQHLEFLPLALLALDSLLCAPRVRHAVWLGVWFAMQALTSVYFLVFSAIAMIAAVLVRPGDWLGSRFRVVVPRLVLSAVVAGVILAPFLSTYWLIRHEHGVSRTLGEVEHYSAIPTDYLATGGLFHFKTWSQKFLRTDALFPGVLALFLAGTAVFSRTATRDKVARMLLGIGLVTCYLSFGTNVPLYASLFRTIPTFDGIRGVARFGHYALIAVAGLAGFGAAWWLARLQQPRWRTVVAIVLIVFVNGEAWRGPLVYREYRGTPRIFRTLAGERGAVVAYFPFYWWGAEIGLNGRYMLASTTNWKPMLNGYSGFMPASFWKHVDHLRDFPDEQSFRYLREQGVTHMVVDTSELDEAHLQQLKARLDIILWMTDGRYSIYRWR